MDKQEYSEFWLNANADSYNNRKKPWHKERIDCVVDNIPKGSTVLDIACGNGEITGYIKKKGCNITGYEIGEQAVAFCKKRHPDIKFIQGDCLDMPFNKHSFEWIHAGEIIEHLENPEQLIKYISHICSKGAVITTPDRVVDDPQHIAVWTQEALRDMLLHYFTSVEIKNPARTFVAVCEHKRKLSNKLLVVSPITYRRVSGASVQWSNQMRAIVKAGYEVDHIHFGNTHVYRPEIDGVNYIPGADWKNLEDMITKQWKRKNYTRCLARSPQVIDICRGIIPEIYLIGYVYGAYLEEPLTEEVWNHVNQMVIQGDKRYLTDKMKSPCTPIDVCTEEIETPFLVGHIGASGLNDYHDLQCIVDAVEIVREKHKVKLMHIGGTDISRDWLLTLPKLPHKLLPCIIKSWDCFCTIFHPSPCAENLMSTKGLEIASLGVPIITDPCYGYTKMLGSKYKLYASTPEEIAEKITYLIENPNHKISDYLKKRVDKFSIDSVSKQWQAVLK